MSTGGPHRSSQQPGGRRLWFVVLALLVLAGGAAAGVLLTTRHGTPGAAPTHRVTPTGSHRAITDSPPPTPTPTTASPSPTSSGPVTLGAGAAANPLAPQVVPLLNSYFTAINAHDYQQYVTLLAPQLSQSLTAAQFRQGYSSTTDSGETLTGISTAAGGNPVAAVTFTSHQNAGASANGQSCTRWSISLFLVPGGSNGYLIGKAPPGYHASAQDCP